MDNIQFFYGRSGRSIGDQPDITIAVDVPNFDTLWNTIDFTSTENKSILIRMGVARRHPEDQFCKKVGRDLATVRMKETPFTLFQIRFHEKETTFILENDCHFHSICFSSRAGKKSLRLFNVVVGD